MKSTPKDLHLLSAKVTQLLCEYLDNAQSRKGHVLLQKPYQEIASDLQLESYIKNGGLDVEKVGEWLETYLENSQHMHHPKYMGHQVAVPHIASGIADFIHGVINNPMAIYEMGPSAAVIEQVVINWMLSKVGWFHRESLHQLPELSGGVLTHGGSLANLTALLAARAVAAPKAWEYGTPKDLVVLGSDVAHYSILRSISIIGMGSKSFLKVQTNQHEVMDSDDLFKVYQSSLNDGKRTMAVIANACATSTGLYDPLEEIGAFCKENNLWFHVDGAHGASALLSERHKRYMKGVEYADSLIWDTHKMLRTSTLSAAVLFKNRDHMARALSQKGSYLFHEKEEPGFDVLPFTIECTKGGLGTKLFWVLAAEGEQGLEDFVTSRYDITIDFYYFLKEQKDFLCPYFPQANILCFKYLPVTDSNILQLRLRNQIVKEGEFYITSTEIKGERYLRVVVINPLTTMEDLKGLVKTIRSIQK